MATTIRSIESGPDMWHRWIFKEKLWRFGIFPVPKQGLAAKVLWNCRGGFHPFLQDLRLSGLVIIKKPSDLRMASRIPPTIFWNLEFFNFPGLVIKFCQPGRNSGTNHRITSETTRLSYQQMPKRSSWNRWRQCPEAPARLSRFKGAAVFEAHLDIILEEFRMEFWKLKC